MDTDISIPLNDRRKTNKALIGMWLNRFRDTLIREENEERRQVKQDRVDEILKRYTE